MSCAAVRQARMSCEPVISVISLDQVASSAISLDQVASSAISLDQVVPQLGGGRRPTDYTINSPAMVSVPYNQATTTGVGHRQI